MLTLSSFDEETGSRRKGAMRWPERGHGPSTITGVRRIPRLRRHETTPGTRLAHPADMTSCWVANTRQFWLLLGAGGLLLACGSGADANDPSGTEPDGTTPAGTYVS